VRAVAVLSVLVFHMALFRVFAPPWLGGGHLGVDLFFALSGFLITALLLREFADNRRIKLLAFYGRRILRLYPALVLVLVATTIYVVVTHGDLHAQAVTVGSAAFYFLNWNTVLGAHLNTDLGHLWSLSIEEQFYLFWPPILIGLIAMRTRVWVTAGFLVAAIVAVVTHRLMLVSANYPWLFLQVRTDTKIDTILFGCLGAVLWTYGRTPVRFLNAAATIATAYIIWALRNVSDQVHSYEVYRLLFALSAVVVILAVVNGTWFAMWFLVLRPMRAIGRVSYGLYLWHLPVFAAVARLNLPDQRQRIALALAITTVAALLSWFLVEKTVLRVKRRLEPPRPPGPHHEPSALPA
jgi:peptidoglycan/LPS O-acetylase OafA/YrhL